MNGRVIMVWSLLIAHVGVADLWAQSIKKPQSSQYQGCYAVALAAWNPRVTMDAQYTTPPSTIELTGIRVESFKKTKRFIARPVLGAKAGVWSISHWYLNPEGQIEIVFTTGFMGVSMRLAPEGSALVGTATWSGDDNPGEHTSIAGARADRVSCKRGVQ